MNRNTVDRTQIFYNKTQMFYNNCEIYIHVLKQHLLSVDFN